MSKFIPQKIEKPAVNVGFHAGGRTHITIYGELFRMVVYATYPNYVDTTQYITWELKEGESWSDESVRFVRSVKRESDEKEL